MSDPYGPLPAVGGVNPVAGGISVAPNALWKNPKQDNQICDYEGDLISYRLNNGVLVQPYWSQSNEWITPAGAPADNAWLIPDGNRQTFFVDPTTNTLDIYGDQLGPNWNDTITIDQVTDPTSTYGATQKRPDQSQRRDCYVPRVQSRHARGRAGQDNQHSWWRRVRPGRPTRWHAEWRYHQRGDPARRKGRPLRRTRGRLPIGRPGRRAGK